jgi:hypothetical protein
MMGKAREVLVSMANHFDSNHPLTTFIHDKAGHLLVAPEGDTGIPYSFFDKGSLCGHTDTIKLESTYHPSQFSNSAGVYMAHAQDANVKYIGSATDFKVR